TENEDVEFGKDEPKAPTLTLKDTLTKIYDGSPCESIPYFETDSDGQVTVTFAKGATQLSSPPTAAGRYVVIIDTAATDTYKAARASVTFYIHKITPFLTMTDSVEVSFTGKPAHTPSFSTDSDAEPVIEWKTAQGTALESTPIAPGKYFFTVTLPETDTYKGAFKSIPYVIVSSGGWDGTPATAFEKGDGTENAPFEIKTAAQLAYLSALLADEATYETYASAHYLLTDDIELNEGSEFYELWSDFAPANAWSPIGASSTYPFSGVFDGGGFAVKGLYLQTNTLKDVGLFGYLEGACVKNLSLSCVYFESTYKESYVGALCGSANDSQILNISVANACIAATRSAGGICGQGCINAPVHIEDASVSNTKISATTNGGGIAGSLKIHGAKFSVSGASVASSTSVSAGTAGGIFATAGSNPICQLEDCHVSATLSATSGSAGGMVANISYTTGYTFSLADCTFDGTVAASTYGGGIFAKVGGTAGFVTMQNVTVKGKISAAEGIVGGVIGSTSAACRDTFENLTLAPTLEGATKGGFFGELTASAAERMNFASISAPENTPLVGTYTDLADTFDTAAFEAQIKQSQN
ncbi:MAG: hypothetical protein J6R40_03785, partial [Clostridia bacterium]|nr:hypothetical protein [Clostridia bacterium]